VAIAVWNGTLDQSKAGDDPLLRREVVLDVTGLGPGPFAVRHYRVDAAHSNIAHHWESLGGGEWPDDAGWAALHDADRLEALQPVRAVDVGQDGRLELAFDLPMPAVSLIELIPAR
jgi:xylan 1,4-beta-xylosidase